MKRTVELLSGKVINARPDLHSDTVSRVGSSVEAELWMGEEKRREESATRR